ncbi:piggyBac transposable element-derived protein 2 [Hydra vulgaris]|uniref:piggyBac transposable element-derived protein 2 n=1 Tax=Hydra vulgaris TaxID=6087 RepID=UPI001F5FF2C3|nr:piggyBac transposable element-derived protein 2-like [Hydra vulgaris]
MSVVKLPSTRDYWSSSIGIAHVANIMPVNRFEKLKSIIRFADNNSADKDDKLFKIRPLINKMNEQLNSIPFEENLAVDEQIIPFKERHLIKQYNPKKPHKWGFKVFVLSGVSGFSYNFEVYCGGSDYICFENEPDLGRGIQMVGTARRNRVGNCPVLSDKETKQRGRGAFTEHVAKVDGVDVSVVSWFDNKVVTLMSNFIGSEPSIEVSRKRKAGRPSLADITQRVGSKIAITHEAIQSDQVGHWPIFNEKRTRCKYDKCSALTYLFCEKCDTALCLNKDRNCFKAFHQ